ncbi:MAG: winged helix-turn-helix transcriptional regulator [Promethearchaeota archaeon]
MTLTRLRKNRVVLVFLFSVMVSGIVGSGSFRGVSGWSVSNVEVQPGVPRDIIFSNMIFHISANVTTYVSLTVDNNLRQKEISLEIFGNSTLDVTVDARADFSDKRLMLGRDIDVFGSDKKYRYSFGIAFEVHLNMSDAMIEYGANVHSVDSSKDKLSWVGKDLTASDDAPWDLLESNLTGDYLYAVTGGDGYYAIAEEYTPFNAFWLLILVPALGVLGVSILVLSRGDYFRNVSARLRGEHVPVHRMSFEKVMANDIRKALINLIFSRPGIHFNELMRELGLNTGALNWHLRVLEDYKVIKKEKIGQYLSYFPRIPLKKEFPLYREAIKLMKNENALAILRLLLGRGRMFQSELAMELGVEKKTIRYHGNKLFKDGLIEFVQDGGRKYHLITEKGRELLGTLDELSVELED